jgi:hypothetical protein
MLTSILESTTLSWRQLKGAHQTYTSAVSPNQYSSIRKTDEATLQLVRDCEGSCVLRNPRNSQAERDRSNRARREARGKKAAVQSQAHEDIRSTQAQIKQLQRELKEKRESAGIKRTPTKKGVVGKAQTDFELCLLDTIEEAHQDSGETDSDGSMYGEEASTSLQLRLAVEDRSSSPAASGLLQVPQTPAHRPAARLCTLQSERTFWRERDAEGWQEFLDEL